MVTGPLNHWELAIRCEWKNYQKKLWDSTVIITAAYRKNRRYSIQTNLGNIVMLVRNESYKQEENFHQQNPNSKILSKEVKPKLLKQNTCCEADKNVDPASYFCCIGKQWKEQRRDNSITINNNLFCRRLQFDGRIRDGISRDSRWNSRLQKRQLVE